MVRALFTLLMLAPVAGAANDIETLASEIAAGRHADIEGMTVLRHGQILAEGHVARLDDGGLDIRSATKSITAMLVGIAMDRGLIGSLETPAIDMLPEYAKQLGDDPRKARIRIVDLLTMRSGLDCDDWNPQSPGHEDRMYRRRDWLAFWAKTPMREEPGTQFSYCTGNVVALGRILANVSGQPVSAFAREHLFDPLGIGDARWETWNRDRDTDTGGHLHIHPRALARIGQLLLDRGRAGDRVVLSESWIDAMTAEHTTIPNHPQSYGYLWWVHSTTRPELPRTRLWMAWGDGGNYLIVMPELNAIVAFAGRRYNKPEAREPLHWLGLRILPALGGE